MTRYIGSPFSQSRQRGSHFAPGTKDHQRTLQLADCFQQWRARPRQVFIELGLILDEVRKCH
jgi:hypothetical protein